MKLFLLLSITFFNRLIDVKQIITYGHSMSEIDWPYFEEIINKMEKKYNKFFLKKKDIEKFDLGFNEDIYFKKFRTIQI